MIATQLTDRETRTKVRILSYGGRGHNVFQPCPHYKFSLLNATTQPLYQEISAKSVQLHQLGLSMKYIATKLKVDEKTVSKAIDWVKNYRKFGPLYSNPHGLMYL